MRRLVVDPANPNRVFALVREVKDGGFPSPSSYYELSEDAGQSWKRIDFSVDALAVDPTRALRLYALSGDGVFRSLDGGRTWRQISAFGTPDPNPGIYLGSAADLAVDPAAPANLYAARWDGFWRSRDGGRTFEPMNAGLQNDFLRLSRILLAPGRLYAAGESTIHRPLPLGKASKGVHHALIAGKASKPGPKDPRTARRGSDCLRFDRQEPRLQQTSAQEDFEIAVLGQDGTAILVRQDGDQTVDRRAHGMSLPSQLAVHIGRAEVDVDARCFQKGDVTEPRLKLGQPLVTAKPLEHLGDDDAAGTEILLVGDQSCQSSPVCGGMAIEEIHPNRRVHQNAHRGPNRPDPGVGRGRPPTGTCLRGSTAHGAAAGG